MSYRFLEHPSDIIIEAEGEGFENALEELARGMITQMGAKNAKKKEKTRFEVAEKENKEDDVVAVLTEIIATCEAEPFTPVDLKIKKSGGRFVIELEGERKQPENIIKAVTYHGLKAEQLDGKYRLTVLFDI